MTVRYVYIHIPFCLNKCSYCSFFSQRYSSEDIKKYLLFLESEIDFYLNELDIKAKTIYFGGGTPSLINSRYLQKIISKFPHSDCEITIEANPINLTKEYVKALTDTEINRVSIGCQSFREKELKILNRVHNSNIIYDSVNNLRSMNFNNISLDLIYGLPNQKMSDLFFSLKKIVELSPEHISTYLLSLDKNVLLYAQKNNIPNDDLLAEFYYLIYEYFESNGYFLYEISNFAKKNKESRHNLSYWKLKNYLGLGASASGFINNYRYKNPFPIDKYYDYVKNKEINYKKELSDEKFEFIMLKLRLESGFKLEEYNNTFDEDFYERFKVIIEKYLKTEHVIFDGERIKLSPKSYFISNFIIGEFLSFL